MGDWAEESPSDEEDLRNIENDLYSVFYYHSMSEGLPGDLAEKYDLDQNDFGVTISLKKTADIGNDSADKEPPNNQVNPSDGQSTPICSRYVDRHNGKTVRGEKYLLDGDDSDVPPDFIRLETVSSNDKTVCKGSRVNNKKITVSSTNNLFANDRTDIPSESRRMSDSSRSFFSSAPSNKKNELSKERITYKNKDNTIDLTLDSYQSNDKKSKKKKKKSKRKSKKKQIQVITISSDSEEELDDSVSNCSTDSDCSLTSKDLSHQALDSIVLNTFTPSYLENYETHIIDSDYNWKQTSSPDCWTKSMRKFYNKPSKRHLDFDYKDVLHEIRKQGTGNWTICNADLYRVKSSRRVRCIRCQQEGHVKAHCTKVFSCHMCGISGHTSNRCPSKMCLKCGSKRCDQFQNCCTDCTRDGATVCSVCETRGHSARTCTNAWRSTFQLDNGKNLAEERTRTGPKYCCNCGKKGHIYEDCRKSPVTHSLKITSYSNCGKVNTHVNLKRKRKRDVNYSDMDDNTSANYGSKPKKEKYKFHNNILKNNKKSNRLLSSQFLHSNEKSKNRILSKRILMLKKANKRNKLVSRFSATV